MKAGGRGVFFSDLPIPHTERTEIARTTNRAFAGQMVGVGFAGDVLAVFGGLLLAFWMRFETPVRALGRRAADPDDHGAVPRALFCSWGSLCF